MKSSSEMYFIDNPQEIPSIGNTKTILLNELDIYNYPFANTIYRYRLTSFIFLSFSYRYPYPLEPLKRFLCSLVLVHQLELGFQEHLSPH